MARTTVKDLEDRLNAKDEADDELHTDLTNRMESAEASLRKAHARLDAASKAFNELRESSSSGANSRQRPSNTRQTRFSCTVDKCEGHANQATVSKHQAAVSS